MFAAGKRQAARCEHHMEQERLPEGVAASVNLLKLHGKNQSFLNESLLCFKLFNPKAQVFSIINLP